MDRTIARPEESAMSADKDELRAFLVMLRRALLMVCHYIEQRYIEQRRD